MDSGLLALSRAEFEEAKVWFRRRYYAHAVTLVFGLIALFAPPPFAYILAVGALISEGAAWWLRYQGGGLQSTAEEGKRQALLIDAFGGVQEPFEVADLRHRFSRGAYKRASDFEDPTYYASVEAPGPARLRDNLQESAFWSKHLYAAAARRAFGNFIGLFLSVLLVALLALPLAAGNASLAIARALVVFLGVVSAVDELGRALSWSTAASQVEAADRRLQQLDVTTVTPTLSVFADYSVATATVPPIPSGVHKREGEQLNRLWAERSSHRVKNGEAK